MERYGDIFIDEMYKTIEQMRYRDIFGRYGLCHAIFGILPGDWFI
jgi:hypothetical protein